MLVAGNTNGVAAADGFIPRANRRDAGLETNKDKIELSQSIVSRGFPYFKKWKWILISPIFPNVPVADTQ
jgi:hypothetical protein